MCGVHGRREGGGAHPVLPPVSPPLPLAFHLPEGVMSEAGACLSSAHGAQTTCMTVSMACASSLVHPPVVDTVWERVGHVRCRLMLTTDCRGVR